jgi:hypothetical protein
MNIVCLIPFKVIHYRLLLIIMSLIDIQTKRASTIITTLQIVSKIAPKANIKFIKNKNESDNGLKIAQTDPFGRPFLNVHLSASEFDKYGITSDKCFVINFKNLCKNLKYSDEEIKNEIESVTFRMKKDKKNTLAFDVNFNNRHLDRRPDHRTDHHTVKISNEKSIQPKPFCCDVLFVINISCKTFHNACKSKSPSSLPVKISCDSKKFAISSVDDKDNRPIVFLHNKDTKESDNVSFEGMFNSNHINSIQAIHTLSDTMEIYLCENKLMILKYGIETMGTLVLAVYPEQDPEQDPDNDQDADQDVDQDGDQDADKDDDKDADKDGDQDSEQ